MVVLLLQQKQWKETVVDKEVFDASLLVLHPLLLERVSEDTS